MVCPAPVMLRALRQPGCPGRPPIDDVRRRAYGQSVFRALARLALVALAAGLVVGAAASAVVPKVTLEVEVGGQGDGTVVSHPAGLSCPLQCRLRVRKGTRVVLTAKPSQGSQSTWMNACGASLTCTVTMTASKTVTIVFKLPQPPPPPPPPAKSGHYAGTYSDGGAFTFDVGPSGSDVENIDFPNNGHCGGGYTLTGEGYAPGPYTINSDGSFSAADTHTFSDGTVQTTQVSGKIASDGSASGTANVSVTFGPGPSAGLSCSSTGTWSAKLGS
jgi:hypothetical protein